MLGYSVINRDGRSEDTTVVDATKIPDLVSDSPSSLVVIIDITGVSCSVEIGRSVSVVTGSIVTSRDLFIITTDSVAFNNSVVDHFIVNSKLSKDESTVVDCTVRDLMIIDEVFVSSPISLKGLLVVAEGTITEAETEEVTDIDCSVVGRNKGIVAAAVISVLGEVLEYSEVDRGGTIDGSTLIDACMVTDGKIPDGEGEFTAVLVIIVAPISMTWDSVVVAVSTTFEDV